MAEMIGMLREKGRERQARDLGEGLERGLWFCDEAAEHVVFFIGNFCRHTAGRLRGRKLVLADWQREELVRPLFGWMRLPAVRRVADGGVACEASRRGAVWESMVVRGDGASDEGEGSGVFFSEDETYVDGAGVRRVSPSAAEGMDRNERLRAGIYRRYRVAYVEIAKKNGKSLLAAAIMLYLLCGDLEGGAEVYAAATKRDQARLVFEMAGEMVKMEPYLRSRVNVFRNNVSFPALGSKLEPLSADYNTLDGLNIHGLSADELHRWTRELWAVLRYGFAARLQPLLFAITTAGEGTEGVCLDQRRYSEKVLTGVVVDDSFFCLVCSLDEGDDWRDESVWGKANPNLGVSVFADDLRDEMKQVEGKPSEVNDFKRFRLNLWVNAADVWLDVDLWRACAAQVNESGNRGNGESGKELPTTTTTTINDNPDGVGTNRDPEVSGLTRIGVPGELPVGRRLWLGWREALKGRACFVGLDLSRSIDLTAMALIFPPVEVGSRKSEVGSELLRRDGVVPTSDFRLPTFGGWLVLTRFWCPEAMVAKRRSIDGTPYDVWARDGWITPTPGDWIDHAFLESELWEAMEWFDVKEVGFDPMLAAKFVTDLQNRGMSNLVEVRQGPPTLSAPMKEVERLVIGGGLRHCGNPVMTWCMSNCVVRMDVNKGIAPDHRKSFGHIDGVSALVTGMRRAIVLAGMVESVYEGSGLMEDEATGAAESEKRAIPAPDLSGGQAPESAEGQRPTATATIPTGRDDGGGGRVGVVKSCYEDWGE